jgi:dihydroorotate dehydrogenase
MSPSLATVVNGIAFENPFLLASGPPGTNGKVIAKSFDLGWGGMVIKTISLDSSLARVERGARLREHRAHQRPPLRHLAR